MRLSLLPLQRPFIDTVSAARASVSIPLSLSWFLSIVYVGSLVDLMGQAAFSLSHPGYHVQGRELFVAEWETTKPEELSSVEYVYIYKNGAVFGEPVKLTRASSSSTNGIVAFDGDLLTGTGSYELCWFNGTGMLAQKRATSPVVAIITKEEEEIYTELEGKKEEERSRKMWADLSSSHREKARQVFNKINRSGNESLSEEDLAVYFAKGGFQVRIKDISLMMNEVDTDGDGSIDWEEFKQMVFAAQAGRVGSSSPWNLVYQEICPKEASSRKRGRFD